MSSSRLSAFLKVAAKQTAKGAAVTLTSTIASCALACYIEIGAHRLVYHYFPHKYAHVEHANGLTQEQLDAVRIYKTNATDDAIAVASRMEDEEKVTVKPPSAQKGRSLEQDSNRFWSDMPKPALLYAAKEGGIQRQEILACAMTG